MESQFGLGLFGQNALTLLVQVCLLSNPTPGILACLASHGSERGEAAGCADECKAGARRTGASSAFAVLVVGGAW